MKITYNEFHINREIREKCDFSKTLFSSSGNVIFADFKAVQEFQIKLNKEFEKRNQNEKKVSAGSINAMGLIDEIFHFICASYRRDKAPNCFKILLEDLNIYFGKKEVDALLLQFIDEFPPVKVFNKEISAEEFLNEVCYDDFCKQERSNREQLLEELIMLHLANENPAFHSFKILFDDTKLSMNPNYIKTWNQIKAYFLTQPVYGPKNNNLISMFKEPVVASPTSLKGQLDYIRTYWADLLTEWIKKILYGMDTITEEEKASWSAPVGGFSPDLNPPSYENLMKEYERFSPDREWMPKVVLMAKTVLVWLYQLRKKYNADIYRLDQIPDEELDALRDQGFTGLWLIGLWERSNASKRIKQINGNPEAAASAYSLLDYEIAANLGGWSALENLRYRCWSRGIRLASDMVPNHTGMDGTWVTEHPNYFITTKECPFPQYTFTGENLSHDSRVSIYLEDHYYSKSDCAVCYKRVDNYTGDVIYIYHGNDGTGLPWNDTAQIDFLNPEAREAVMQQILKVARNFPIIRFDAAMVLAKKHIRRLWYPEPGHGGDIASRSRYALTTQQFEDAIPNEFWREVVDRCAQEMPDTLLLAEAFWMMEGYFTRTLGMHRVYNSAFMNMLKKEENQKYRDTVKNTIKFDPQVLKRFVNFMNNPDEETAVAQFGKGDKYFGVCTLMITMPGLPMFGHGQLEGFEEKYGMEYTRAYKDEQVDYDLMNRHQKDIFPLLHKRYLFAGVENFLFYDVWNEGCVNENIFAYSNRVGKEGTIVFYNNKYDRACGWIKQSCEYAVKTGSGENDVQMYTKSLAEGLGLSSGADHYCIFKEHRSGLWYIRKSDDLINNGMFVSLNGFEYQVYLDIQEVVDTEDKKYELLHNILNGKGVKNFEIAWQEYKYKELYEGLNSFLSLDFFENLDKLFELENLDDMETKSEKKEFNLKDFVEKIKDSGMEYFALEEKFETEELKSKSVKEEKLEKPNAKAKKVEKLLSVKSAKERYETFCDKFESLYENFKETLEENKNAKKLSLSLNNLIFQEIRSKKLFLKVLVSFLAGSSLKKEILTKWGYSRKLSEILESVGLISSTTEGILENLIVMKEFENLSFTASNKDKNLNLIAKLMMGSDESKTLSGQNEFNNIKWFNKEKFEESLIYEFGYLSLNKAKTAQSQLFKLYNDLIGAEEKSEYKCESFLKLFSSKELEKKNSKSSDSATVKKSVTATKSKEKKDNSSQKKSKTSVKDLKSSK